VDAYSGMELCTSIWLNYNNGDREVMDISTVDAYFRVEVCTPILGYTEVTLTGVNRHTP
jgi:hypothetical protein